MSDDFTIYAEPRTDVGKGASRRLRREGSRVPAIVYGGNKKPENITVPYKELAKQLENEAFYSHIITINLEEKSQDVILKDLQRHPSRGDVLHADFMRVSKTKKLHTNVPLHFLNEESCHGVKMQGGLVNHNMIELEVACLPGNLPEYIEVDVADLNVGDILHISDLQLPKGVESLALQQGEDHDHPVVTVTKPKRASTSEEDEEGEPEEGEGGEGEDEGES